MKRQDIVVAVEDRSAAGIVAAVGRLITGGDLAAGERLPTVRELAHDLGVSPATVSQAWQQLRRAGLLHADGRRGTVVREPAQLTGPTRFGRLHAEDANTMLDLSESVPDPALLPDVHAALAQVSAGGRPPTSYFDNPVVPALEDLLRSQWPFVPEALTVVDGAMDALDRLLTVHVRPGDRVLVESPTYPPVLDLLDLLGAQVRGLPTDDEGLDPNEVREQLAQHDIRLVVIQPRGQNPSGHSYSSARMEQLADVLASSSAMVVEDDHSAGICLADPVSLGAWLPQRTAHIRGFSKALGPDLRMAAVGGASDLLLPMMRRRLLGSGWSSRLLQEVLHVLLTDETPRASTLRARDAYAARRTALLDALAARDVPARGRDGANVWVTVLNEQQALVNLALRRIAVAPGSAFMSAPDPHDHLRIACEPLSVDRVDAVADAVAVAARAHRGR